ncbi:hypothetical protein K6T82_21395 [Flavobacterium sp. 17A]|uniref:Uncharacterized protein n=1 Tax=Flavobacterium potami TaxID=2872310 RepID=A0A9X1KSB9_9FLAO|nr:hypothetical protein [Flavobacterium potami]MBZ4037329.1 hypothetical protein [Flavobacterium potami]
MKDLILESKGIKTDQYFIPPFELYEGELIVIYMENHRYLEDMKLELVSIFAGIKKHKNVKVIKPLTFARPIEESMLKRIIYPMNVRQYLKRNAELKSSVVSRIFEIDSFTKKHKIKNLNTSERKRLSLCSVFSKTKNVSFDLRGEGADYYLKTYEFVKEEIKNGGAAILIDWSDDLKNNCSKFITIEWTVEFEELKKIIDGSIAFSKMCD